MNLYLLLSKPLDIISVFAIVLTFFLIGLFADTIIFTTYSLLKHNRSDIRKYVFRLVLVSLMLFFGLIVMSAYFPEYLSNIFSIDILTFISEVIRILHDAFLVFSLVSFGYAIFLKTKGFPGAIWHIKKFSAYYVLSLFFVSIIHMYYPYPGVLSYMLYLFLPFVFFQILYYLYRMFKEEKEKKIKDIKQKITPRPRYLLLAMILIFISITIGILSPAFTKLSSKINIKQHLITNEYPVEKERDEYNEAKQKYYDEEDERKWKSVEYENPLFNQLYQEILSQQLDNIIVQYPEITLNDSSTGIIAIISQKKYYELSNNGEDIRFLYLDENTNTIYSLTKNLVEILYTIDNKPYQINPFLFGNDIYFLFNQYDDTRLLEKLNLFTKVRETIYLQYRENETIHDFFIREDLIYYISSQPCTYDEDYCKVDLYSYNILTKDTVLLATNIYARNIIGFDETNTKLILKFSYGEPTCSWDYSQYNIVKKELVEEGPGLSHYCGKEILLTEIESRWENSKNRNESLVVNSFYVPYLIIQEGVISFPKEKIHTYDSITKEIKVSTYER